MIDMRDDIRESSQATRSITEATKVPKRFKVEPQAFLEATHLPYAPFPGDTLRWDSWVWHDASMYALLELFDECAWRHCLCRIAWLAVRDHASW